MRIFSLARKKKTTTKQDTTRRISNQKSKKENKQIRLFLPERGHLTTRTCTNKINKANKHSLVARVSRTLVPCGWKPCFWREREREKNLRTEKAFDSLASCFVLRVDRLLVFLHSRVRPHVAGVVCATNRIEIEAASQTRCEIFQTNERTNERILRKEKKVEIDSPAVEKPSLRCGSEPDSNNIYSTRESPNECPRPTNHSLHRLTLNTATSQLRLGVSVTQSWSIHRWKVCDAIFPLPLISRRRDEEAFLSGSQGHLLESPNARARAPSGGGT